MYDFRTHLLISADRYCRKHKISLSTLGLRVANDDKFFAGIRSGERALTDVKYHQFMAEFVADNIRIPRLRRAKLPPPTLLRRRS